LFRFVSRARDLLIRYRLLRTRASERTFAAAFRAIPDAAVITRLDDGRVLAVNDALEELIGYRRKDVLGRTTLDLRWWPSPEARDAFQAMLGRSGRVRRLPARLPDATGRLHDALLSAEVIEVLGEPHILTVAQDVTEIKQAEEALQLSDSILQRIEDLVIVAGPDGGIRYVSPSVKNVLGYEPAEVLGDGWWHLTFTDPVAREQERSRVARVARGEIPSQGAFIERPVRARDGKTRWILWHDSKGPGELLIGVGVDVTERRALEEQFRQAQKMEAVGRLAGGIAHDFNNLLTVITGYTDLLLSQMPADDPRQADLQEIRRAADRAATLTRQLLAYSRQQVLVPRTIGLNQVIEPMRNMMQRLIGEDITLRTHLEAAGRVRADPHQLEQVLLNLAVNARDAMPDGGSLTIATRDLEVDEHAGRAKGIEPGSYVELVVSDTGLGMSEEVLAHLFQPFFTTKPVGMGTGLGLATVYGIVKQSGGHIWAASRPGEGATFTIYLPRVQDAAEGEARSDNA